MYKLSDSGLKYVEALQPKENKEKKATTKSRKPRTKTESQYKDLNIDDLNLDKYPQIKALKGIKAKMIMAMHMITSEKKGEWFTASDASHILIDKFGESATEAQIKGVFKNNKTWFKSENIEGSNRDVKRKLLNGGKQFAESLMSESS